MPRQTKRTLDVVDLTGDAQGTRPVKSPRYPSSSYTSPPSAARPSRLSSAPSSQATPPSSASLAGPSQRFPGNDDVEPSTQDLTQSDDGPQLELYGSFGMHLLNERADPSPRLTVEQTARLWV
jgi:SWI/SNF-related matrix-associated actin-dependent regulator of chromatin subfamily A3